MGVIYWRPNTNIDDFIDNIDRLLLLIKSEKKICYLTGDFNINLLNVDKHVASHDFLECMYSQCYLPLINKRYIPLSCFSSTHAQFLGLALLILGIILITDDTTVMKYLGRLPINSDVVEEGLYRSRSTSTTNI